MPTKFIKLGFEDRVLSEQHFYPLELNGNTVGFNLGIYLNYYRGLAVSCIERLELKIDGEPVPTHLICVVIDQKKFTVDQLQDLYAEFWGIRKRIDLEIYNGGLPAGEHNVELRLELRNPYMRFAPNTYGAIDSSARKTLFLSREAFAL